MTNRCVDTLVGMQAGSEGKGKLVSVLGRDYKALVRTGGTNSAHTSYAGTKKFLFHQLPCGSVNFPMSKLVLGANTHIDLEYLFREIQLLKDNDCWLIDGKPRLYIDKNATLVESVDKVAENGGRMPECGDLYFHPRDCNIHNDQLHGTCVGCSKISSDSAWVKLGSTTHGCGANAIRRILRGTRMALMAGQPFKLKEYVFDKLAQYSDSNNCNSGLNCFLEALEECPITTDWSKYVNVAPIKFAGGVPELKEFVCDTVPLLNKMVDDGCDVLLEGTQGSLLSLFHGYMGKTTSRDTNASTWFSEAGLSPLCARDVYGVARVYPIRVAGASGDLSGEEITWEEVTRISESPKPIVELTSATKRKRRVFCFGHDDFKKSIQINRPTKLMLSFVDQHHYTNFGKTDWCNLHENTREWIESVEKQHGVHFDYLSTGPKQMDIIIR